MSTLEDLVALCIARVSLSRFASCADDTNMLRQIFEHLDDVPVVQAQELDPVYLVYTQRYNVVLLPGSVCMSRNPTWGMR